MQKPAIFLDRDGTIIQDVGYITDIKQVEFYPFSFTSLRALSKHFQLFIVTNQTGIAKGFQTEEEVLTVNAYIESVLLQEGIVIEQTYCCPHAREDNCNCRKPSPYFINDAASQFDIDISESFMIGDHPSDVECGLNAGVTPIYVLSGHGEKHQQELKQSVIICHDLEDATASILSQTE